MTGRTRDAVSLDALDHSLGAVSPALDDADRRIVAVLYRSLAGGVPIAPDALARDAGVPPAVVTERLGTWPGVFRDDEGAVVGFWGIAIPEMDHRVRVGDGPQVHAWCAWDPLFLGPLVGDARVETDDPVTGETIRYAVGAGGVRDLSHPGSVLSFLEPDETWDEDVVASFCHYVRHFTSVETGRTWVAEHPGTFLLTVEDAAELARRHAGRLGGPPGGG